MYEIIDAHAHIYPDRIAAKAGKAIAKFYDFDAELEGSVDRLLRLGSEIGVKRYIVHSVATVDHQVRAINTYLTDQAREHKEFVPFMTLHPDMSDEEISDEINFCLDRGVKGVKLHPDFQKFAIDSSDGRRFCDAIGDRLPILFHTGDIRYDYSHPQQLSVIAHEYPEVRFIAAHFGGYSCWECCYQAYKGLKNVWFDTSSSLSFITKTMAEQLIHALGAERFFFGTDYPMWQAKDEYDRFMELNLSERERIGILAGNIKKFLKL